MPMFLSSHVYVSVPLEPSYQAAFDGMPSFCRQVVGGA